MTPREPQRLRALSDSRSWSAWTRYAKPSGSRGCCASLLDIECIALANIAGRTMAAHIAGGIGPNRDSAGPATARPGVSRSRCASSESAARRRWPGPPTGTRITPGAPRACEERSPSGRRCDRRTGEHIGSRWRHIPPPDRSPSRSGGVEQLCAPKGEPVTQTVEVLADQAVLCEVVGVEQLGLGERVGEHASIEGDVRTLGELQ